MTTKSHVASIGSVINDLVIITLIIIIFSLSFKLCSKESPSAIAVEEPIFINTDDQVWLIVGDLLRWQDTDLLLV